MDYWKAKHPKDALLDLDPVIVMSMRLRYNSGSNRNKLWPYWDACGQQQYPGFGIQTTLDWYLCLVTACSVPRNDPLHQLNPI